MKLSVGRRSHRRRLSGIATQVVCAGALLVGAAPGHAQGAPATARPDGTQLPPVTVTGSLLDEERPVGSYRQPEWTTERRFAGTRAYVLPKGMVELEQWWRGTFKRDSSESHRFLTEVAVGLPGRWQLDLYGHLERESGSNTKYIGEQVEARYALADWGRIPLNPTLYLEWKNNHDGPQVLEGKLLLADQARRGWHWAANLSYEEEMGGAREIERALTFGLSKTLRDSKLSVGVESVLEHVTAHGEASETGLLIGPSIQWRPTRTVHLDFVPLFGVTGDAPRSQIYVVLGVNLRQGEKGVNADPISSRSR